MTVNELLAELRKMQRAGYGERPAYIHRQGDDWCMHATKVTKHHNASFGHVVIGSDHPDTLRD